jgi:hypothetical protein
MSWKLEPGYAYSHVKGEGWVDVVVDQSDVEEAKFIGFRQIEGARFGVFKMGRRTVAQLAQNLVPVTERMVGRAPRSAAAGHRKSREGDFVFKVTIAGSRGGRRRLERSFTEYRPGIDWVESKIKGHPGSWADVFRHRRWGGVDQLQGPIGRLVTNAGGHVVLGNMTEPRSVGRARRGAFDPSCHVKHRVTRKLHKVKHEVACGASRHVGAEAGAHAKQKIRYVVIVRYDRSAKGEYDAGHTLPEARRKAKQFLAYVSPDAEVSVAKLVTVRSGTRKGDIVPVAVELVKQPDWKFRAVGKAKR